MKEEYKDYPFSNVFVVKGETDFVVMKEEGVTRYTVDRTGTHDFENPEIIGLQRTDLFQGVILDCEAYIRLFEHGKMKIENVEL